MRELLFNLGTKNTLSEETKSVETNVVETLSEKKTFLWNHVRVLNPSSSFRGDVVRAILLDSNKCGSFCENKFLSDIIRR